MKKSRKLVLEVLEDRSVPATLTTYAAPLPPPPPPPPPIVIGVPSVPLTISAAQVQPAPAGKLATNHNQTLVRDRRRRARRRGS